MQDSDGGVLQMESPLGDTPDSDVACADCGQYRELVGPVTFDGEVVKDGDFVCGTCAEQRGVRV